MPKRYKCNKVNKPFFVVLFLNVWHQQQGNQNLLAPMESLSILFIPTVLHHKPQWTQLADLFLSRTSYTPQNFLSLPACVVPLISERQRGIAGKDTMKQLFCAINRLVILQWSIPKYNTNASNLTVVIFDAKWL